MSAPPYIKEFATQLHGLHLEHHMESLKGLGVRAIDHVHDVEDADLIGIGMKPAEVKRLRRAMMKEEITGQVIGHPIRGE